MESSDRIKDLNNIYGWNLILKSLCNDIKDLDTIVNMDFTTILTWLELQKANEELDYINMELQKNKK